MSRRGWGATGLAAGLAGALVIGLVAGTRLDAAPVAGLDETPVTSQVSPREAPQEAQAGRSGMDISVRGIDDAIKQLNAVQGNPQSQQAAIVLLLIQGAGKKQAPENGRSRYDYHVDIQPDGRILINGLDISVLIQAANPKR